MSAVGVGIGRLSDRGARQSNRSARRLDVDHRAALHHDDLASDDEIASDIAHQRHQSAEVAWRERASHVRRADGLARPARPEKLPNRCGDSLATKPGMLRAVGHQSVDSRGEVHTRLRRDRMTHPGAAARCSLVEDA
jgi:hypothetical protein